MERGIELRIKGHLYEIATTNDDVIESRQGFPAAERGYRKTLTSVAEIAGSELMDEMAAYIKDHIESYKERPQNDAVRREARRRVSKAGYPPDEYLNAA